MPQILCREKEQLDNLYYEYIYIYIYIMNPMRLLKNLMNYIKARKLIFIRTIMVMEEYFPIRGILLKRVEEYDITDHNHSESPLVQILQYCEEFGVFEYIVNMCEGNIPSKSAWKCMVWEKAWKAENDGWYEQMNNDPKLDIARSICPLPAYSIWWALSDSDHRYMRRSEIMVRLICRASLLKNHDGRLKNAPFGSKMCILCQNAAYEDTMHMVSQCEYHQVTRVEMLERVDQIAPMEGLDVFSILMGKSIENWPFEEMAPIWKISCTHIVRMYSEVLKFHKKYNLENRT